MVGIGPRMALGARHAAMRGMVKLGVLKPDGGDFWIADGGKANLVGAC